MRRSRAALLVLLAALLVSGCSATEPDAATAPERPKAPHHASRSPHASPSPRADERPPPFTTSDGAPRDARLAVPRLGIAGASVRSYRGVTDDAAGEAIQDTGALASPHGPVGTGPGGVGNYLVTGHRTSATRIFEFLPDLVRGDRVVVRAGGVAYVYRITGTRITSFRSARSLREQRADVPGHPDRSATRAMITLSTCRTPEDHAEGNYWADELDNPEHRIDKIGVLVRTRPGGQAS